MGPGALGPIPATNSCEQRLCFPGPILVVQQEADIQRVGDLV